MIGITGKHSSITRSFMSLRSDEQVAYGHTDDLPLDCDEYLLCGGVLYGKSASEITDSESSETFLVNYLHVVRFCDAVFEINHNAKVCIIGSESGINGSYDTAYAGTKAALHLYVKTKRLMHPGQHIVCVSPTIIEDAGMTQRRKDLDNAMRRGKERRIGRWLNSAEVARIADFALSEPALCNTIIRATGGNY